MKMFVILLLIFGVCHGYSRYQPKSASSYQDSEESFYNSLYSDSTGNYESSDLETNEAHIQEEPKLTPIAEFDEGVHFTYGANDTYGPKNWGKINKTCDGSRQSPVNIQTMMAFRESGPPLIIDGYNTMPTSITMTNSGHSAVLKFNFANSRQISIRGGPLDGNFTLANVHWHWGRSDKVGSEHRINSNKYAAEMHLVTFNSSYANLSNAVDKPKGLAVIGILYELDNTRNATFPFIPLLSQVIQPETTYTETQDLFSLRAVIKSNDFRYFSYKGSLTTPNCTENVTWLVSKRTLKISSKELAEFRKIRDDEGNLLKHNARPTQKLNFRKVGYY